MDFLSLGQRLNWGQLAVFSDHLKDPATLASLTASIRSRETDLPLIYSAAVMARDSGAVAAYLRTFSKTGVADMGAAMKQGAGGLNELLSRKQRLYDSPAMRQARERQAVRDWQGFTTEICRQQPLLALALKYLCYLLSGFFFAAAAHQLWPAVSALEEPLRVRGFHLAREILFAVGFLLVVLLLSEPFLAQDSQKAALPFRLHLPGIGGAVPAQHPGNHLFNMNQANLLTLLLFFVLQGLLYIACVVKLAEIRRQRVPARMKLMML
jgi:hypothetical protein